MSDPLLPPDSEGKVKLLGESDESQPLWLTVQVPRDATPAAHGSEYVGNVTISLAGATTVVPIALEVWPVAVPTPAEAKVQHVWGFSASHVLPFYPHQNNATTTYQWWRFMEEHRIPPLEAAFQNITDPAHPNAPNFMVGRTGVLEAGLHRGACNCSACPEEAAKEDALAMADVVAKAKAVKTAKFFAYGFDEAPKSCEKSIRTSFKAFLEAYPPSTHPEVAGTMAALNWAAASGGNDGPTGSHPSAGGMPMDMPYTGWVLQYQYYNKTTAGWWVNSTEPVTGRKRELYLCVAPRCTQTSSLLLTISITKRFAGRYHCIEPSQPEYLNIFIERPLIQARLLFWLGAAQNIQGWLYWVTDLWQNCPSSPHAWQHPERTVMRRVNGSKRTDFDPASIIWCGSKLYDFWVNGDGYYSERWRFPLCLIARLPPADTARIAHSVYPGPDGPISTSRLEEIRDALEDMELFRMVPEAKRAAAVAKLVRGPKDHDDDPLRLEAVRREIGRAAHRHVLPSAS